MINVSVIYITGPICFVLFICLFVCLFVCVLLVYQRNIVRMTSKFRVEKDWDLSLQKFLELVTEIRE